MFRLQQDGRDVIEVFSLQMPRFFEAILENPKLLRVVGTLFGSPSVGRPFAQVPAAGALILLTDPACERSIPLVALLQVVSSLHRLLCWGLVLL